MPRQTNLITLVLRGKIKKLGSVPHGQAHACMYGVELLDLKLYLTSKGEQESIMCLSANIHKCFPATATCPITLFDKSSKLQWVGVHKDAGGSWGDKVIGKIMIWCAYIYSINSQERRWFTLRTSHTPENKVDINYYATTCKAPTKLQWGNKK